MKKRKLFKWLKYIGIFLMVKSRKLILIAILGYSFNLTAQDSLLTSQFKENTIQRVTKLLADNYVFAEIGAKTSKHINELNKNGHFDSYQNIESFSLELTSIIYALTRDKHISVTLRNNSKVSDDALNNWIESRMSERNYFRRTNGNFKTVKKLYNNIGYLELRGFYSLDFVKNFIDHAMALLRTSDAIIIDLRNNSGGRGDGASYLVSHFFEKPIITSKSIKRRGNQFIEKIEYSPELKDNKKMPDIPLFILTSGSTFSAAEGFTYILKVYKRATIIGATTKGGANAGDLIQVNKYLNIFIPDVAVSHPVTNDTWEGVGIIPDIQLRSGDALEVAIEKAQVAASKYRKENDSKARTLLTELNNALTKFNQEPKYERILNAYLECKQQNLIFEEWEINSLGYQYFNKKNGQATAEAILRVNTILYPKSANTFDSYSEILIANKKIDLAIINSEKAVFLGKQNNDKNLGQFQENLERIKKLKKQ